MNSKQSISVILAALLWVVAARAGNVDLSTVPERETVQLTIYNSEDLTLVRETRVITFKQGLNPLQFSWANTLIDPTSVELRFPGDPDGLEVLDTTFPHERPQLLYWNVASDGDREATLEISYFTSGISWSADYLAIADRGETQLNLESFVRVYNGSGEDYENAQVRLVVGTINLVEKIAELARLPVGRLQELEESQLIELRQRAAKTMMTAPVAMAAAPAPAADEEPIAAKEVQKEALSEYFIYTIEGTENIPDGWSKRLRSFDAEAVPMSIEYRYRLPEYGDRLVRLYLLRNDEESGLGTTPLPDGTVRIFRDNGSGGLSYLAQQHMQYVPIGDRIELNLGADPEVIFELVKLRALRDNIWMRITQGNLYQRADDPALRIDIDSEVAGWDEHQIFTQRIRNYTGRGIHVEIRRQYPGDVIFRSRLEPGLHDFQTAQFETDVASGETVDLLHEVITRQGYNAEQNRVVLENGDVDANP
jgi:hypothetical protein